MDTWKHGHIWTRTVGFSYSRVMILSFFFIFFWTWKWQHKPTDAVRLARGSASQKLPKSSRSWGAGWKHMDAQNYAMCWSRGHPMELKNMDGFKAKVPRAKIKQTLHPGILCLRALMAFHLFSIALSGTILASPPRTFAHQFEVNAGI